MALKHVIIGTAGHVDHGKTALIKALTGIDTDCLPEEKKRGLSIEAGFACLDFSSELRGGIIDVPGHERFIPNMLSAAGGIDLLMMVIAANEGIMPQTWEHLNILSLLNVKRGVTVISKTDLISPERESALREEILKAFEGTFLQNAPVIGVSAFSGRGLPELRELLRQEMLKMPAKTENGFFRLPIDRVFSAKGFGIVAAGTLLDGILRLNEKAMVYPQEIPVKARNIQIHAQNAAKAFPGQRTAVNISGDFKKEQIKRGCVIASPGSLLPSFYADVRLRILKNIPYRIKNGSRVHVYLASREILAALILLENDYCPAGESCFAQLLFPAPITALRGDKFIIRFYSPLVTLGGGEILDPLPRKLRRRRGDNKEIFAIKAQGNTCQRLEQAFFFCSSSSSALDKLKLRLRAGVNENGFIAARRVLTERGALIHINGEFYLHAEKYARLKNALNEILKQYHKNTPHSPGLPAEEIRHKLMLEKEDSVHLIAFWEKEKFIAREGAFLKLYGFETAVDAQKNLLTDLLEKNYLNYGFSPPPAETGKSGVKEALYALLKENKLISLDSSYFIHREYYHKARTVFNDLYMKTGAVLLGDYRDALKSSRKIALLLLESLERKGFAKKQNIDGILTRIPREISEKPPRL